MDARSYSMNVENTWGYFNEGITLVCGRDAFSLRTISEHVDEIPCEPRSYSNSPRITALNSLEAMLPSRSYYYYDGDRQAAEGYGVKLSTFKWRRKNCDWYRRKYRPFRLFGKKFYTAVSGGSG